MEQINSNVNLPIETFVKGNVIVKICKEESSNFLKKISDIVSNMFYESLDLLYDSPIVESSEGSLIIGKGVAKCNGDIFNLETGYEIAFRKAKLSANIKKIRILKKVINSVEKELHHLYNLLEKYAKYVDADTEALRSYNPEFEFHV